MKLAFQKPFYVNSVGERCGPVLAVKDLPRVGNVDEGADFETVGRIHQERMGVDMHAEHRGEIVRAYEECVEAIKRRVVDTTKDKAPAL